MYLKSQLDLLSFLLNHGGRRDVIDTYRSLSNSSSNIALSCFRDSLEKALENKMLKQRIGDRLVLKYLEMDIVFGCNLRCSGCSHYSNHARLGLLSFEEGKLWLEAWSKKLAPKEFRLLGGEPALNPELTEFVYLVHKLWPQSARAVASNGLLLSRQPDGFFKALGETATALHITIHGTDKEYQNRLRKDWLEQQSTIFKFPIQFGVSLPSDFHHLYRGDKSKMAPFNDDDEWASWINCEEKFCPTIYLGRLWKCPPIAFLQLMEERFEISKNPAWHCALKHKGINPNSSLQQIAGYLSSASSFCNMCPARTH